jgi:META domain
MGSGLLAAWPHRRRLLVATASALPVHCNAPLRTGPRGALGCSDRSDGRKLFPRLRRRRAYALFRHPSGVESATAADDVPVSLDPVYPNRLIFGGVAAVHAIIADLGCNDFSAEGAAIVNGRLELKNPSSTAVGCVEPIVQEREHMLEGLLETRPTVEIAGDLLTLRGTGTATYRRTST